MVQLKSLELVDRLNRLVSNSKLAGNSDTVYITLKRDVPMNRSKQPQEEGQKLKTVLTPAGPPHCLLRVKTNKKKFSAQITQSDATGSFQSKFSSTIRKELDGLKKKDKKKKKKLSGAVKTKKSGASSTSHHTSHAPKQ